MVSKYGHLMLPGVFPDQVTPDIDFTNEVVGQCEVQVVKILVQMPVIYKWSLINFVVNAYGGLMFCFWSRFYA